MSFSEKYNCDFPQITVFAGPNGSGKSSITMKFPVTGTYVNADSIKKLHNCSDMEAAVKAEKIREMLLASGQDFTFETVLSTDRNLGLLKRAKEAGYKIFAVFVMTCDPQINIERVKKRFEGGGHDVPEDKIISRYEKSLANLAKLVRIADETRVFDNSGDYPVLVCETTNNCATIYTTKYWGQIDVLKLIMKKEV